MCQENGPHKGDVVTVVTEKYEKVNALVTAVHAAPGGAAHPLINVVYVSTDAAHKEDPYGNQVERLTSLCHFAQAKATMEHPGRYWQIHQ